MILISAVISSGVLILMVLVLRRLLRERVSNGILYGMWLIVALRLMMPLPDFLLGHFIGMEFPRLNSTFSVMNAAEQLFDFQKEGTAGQNERFQKEATEEGLSKRGESAALGREEEVPQKEGTEDVTDEKNMGATKAVPEEREGPLDENEKNQVEEIGEGGKDRSIFSYSDVMILVCYVWLAVAVFLLCIQIVGERCLRRRLFEHREEICIQGQSVYKVKGISTPLLIRGRGFVTDIYIPEEILDRKELTAHALLHEKVHQKHGDIWWGYLRNLLVAVYWFHPLVWVAAICSKRDCEYACDSSVVKYMSGKERISYGNSLLSLVQIDGRHRLFGAATEMSMGRSEMRGRIIMVKSGKKRNSLATVLALMVMLGVGISTFTYAKTEENTKGQPKEAEMGQKNQMTDTKESRSQQPQEMLTIEKLTECYQKGEFANWSEGSISKYSNLSLQEEEDSDSLDTIYMGRISFEGVDYQVSISFDEKGAVDAVALENPETEDYRTLYFRNEYYEEYGVSPEEFVHHEEILDERITYQLPEELQLTQDSYKLGLIGRLFYRKGKDRDGLFGVPDTCLWSSAGGVMETNRLRYDEKEGTVRMDLADYLGNGRYAAKASAVQEFPEGKLQNIAGCENMTSIQGLHFTEDIIADTFVWFDKKKAGDLTQKEMRKALLAHKKLWVVSVMDEENRKKEESVGYVFFLDAERYTKKQAVVLAKSIHLLDGMSAPISTEK